MLPTAPAKTEKKKVEIAGSFEDASCSRILALYLNQAEVQHVFGIGDIATPLERLCAFAPRLLCAFVPLNLCAF